MSLLLIAARGGDALLLEHLASCQRCQVALGQGTMPCEESMWLIRSEGRLEGPPREYDS